MWIRNNNDFDVFGLVFIAIICISIIIAVVCALANGAKLF